jgi:hypothetical protein
MRRRQRDADCRGCRVVVQLVDCEKDGKKEEECEWKRMQHGGSIADCAKE